MSTQRDVTTDCKWRERLVEKVAELKCAENMLRRSTDRTETKVLIIATISIEDQIAKYIKHLGGLGAAW